VFAGRRQDQFVKVSDYGMGSVNSEFAEKARFTGLRGLISPTTDRFGAVLTIRLTLPKLSARVE
jgi:hypothetical protein